MAWVFLILAGFGEVAGVFSMKMASERKNTLSFLSLVTSFSLSFFFLSRAMQELPMGTAYAVWTGIGTAGSVIIGILFFREPADWRRIMYLSCIVIGAVGLKAIS